MTGTITGKIAAASIVLSALVAGVAVWYLQIYAFYDEVVFIPGEEIFITGQDGTLQPLAVSAINGIDAASSPLRFRACLTVHETPAEINQRFVPYEGAEPLVAPSWFDCYNAQDIGYALEGGTAKAYLLQANIASDVDRVLAVFPDGRAYAWHQINPAAKE